MCAIREKHNVFLPDHEDDIESTFPSVEVAAEVQEKGGFAG
jgi:hypothetical protein